MLKSLVSALFISFLHTTTAQSLTSTGELVYTYSHSSLQPQHTYNQTHSSDPAAGSSVYDPTFNTNVTKVIDVKQLPASETVQAGAYVRPASSRYSHYNSDGSKLMLLRDATFMDSGTGNTVIVNAHNYTLSTTVGTPLGFVPVYSTAANELRWDRNVEYNNVFYFVSNCVLYAYNIDEDSSTSEPAAVHDFSKDVANCYSIGNGAVGDSSADSRYWAFIVKTSVSGATPTVHSIVTYDKTTDTIVAQLNSTVTGGSLPTPHYVDVSPRATHVLVQWDATGAGDMYDGPHVYSIALTPASAVRVADVGNSTNNFAYNSAGAQVVVAHITTDAWENAPAGTIVSTDITTGSTTVVLYDGDIDGFAANACAWNIGRTYDSQYYGWVHASLYCDYNANYVQALQNQALLLELPSSAATSSRVYIVGYTHNNYNTTVNSANTLYSTISQDMRTIVFGAQWASSKNTWQNTYSINLSQNWLYDLSQRAMPAALGTAGYEPQQSVPYGSNSSLPQLSTPSLGNGGTKTQTVSGAYSNAVVSASGMLVCLAAIILY